MSFFKKFFVLHPFLLSIFPIIFLYSHNIGELSFSEIILPMILLIVFTFAGQLILSLIIRNKEKAAIIVSVSIILFFSYGTVFKLIEGITLSGVKLGKNSYLFILWALIFITCSFLVLRSKGQHNLTNYLNLVVVLLFVLVFINIFNYALRGKVDYREVNLEFSIKNHSGLNEVDKSHLPDIYYIILDGYGSTRTLKKKYNYDNSEFDNFLKDKGFKIASGSHCNYATTMLSLASSLNQEHLVTLGDAMDIPLLYSLIQENRVMSFLKSRGYKTVDLSSNIGKLQHIREADLNLTPGSFLSDEFHTMIIELTMLRAIKERLNFAYFYRQKILKTFDECPEIKNKVDSPFFAFIHILPPHPPYVFGANAEPLFGSLNLNDWGSLWDQKERYRDQVIFVNGMMKNVISRILAESEKKPIIIIQSDHGPQLSDEDKVQARMEIYYAVYLPDGNDGLIYNTITPVNTFRVIFNHYFKTELNLLEDKSYFSNYEIPYEFRDVTKILVPGN